MPKTLVTRKANTPDLEDLILASDPYFLDRYEKARRSPGMSLAELKKSLHASGRGTSGGRF